LYVKFFITAFPWIVLSRSTVSFFCSYRKRTGVISGFDGMGDRFDLVSPPTANKVIAKTFLQDSSNIINNMKNHTSNRNHKSMSSLSSSSLVQEVRRSNFHDHNMLIYPDLATYRKIYSESAKQALDGNEIVLLVTTYDSFDRIKDSLTQADISVNNEIKNGNLVIIDAVRAYQIEVHGALKFATTLAKRAESDGKSGVFGLTEMGSFFIAERIASLLEYERSLPKKWELNNFKSACTYHKDDIATLSKQQQETILSVHNRVFA
jgi:hypothetical protein